MNEKKSKKREENQVKKRRKSKKKIHRTHTCAQLTYTHTRAALRPLTERRIKHKMYKNKFNRQISLHGNSTHIQNKITNWVASERKIAFTFLDSEMYISKRIVM